MEQTFPTKAIVLERLAFREHDSRICLYSLEYGKMDLVVRGSKRPKSKLAGHIEPISEANFMVVKGKQFDYAGSAICLNSFSLLKDNYDLLVESGKAIKFFKKVIEPGVADSTLYELLNQYLLAVNQKNISENMGILYYHIFILKFISELGYQPELATCTLCSSSNEASDYFFNYASGGLVCKTCARGQESNLLISAKTILFLRMALHHDFSEICNLDFDETILGEFKNVLGVYVRFCLGYAI